MQHRTSIARRVVPSLVAVIFVATVAIGGAVALAPRTSSTLPRHITELANRPALVVHGTTAVTSRASAARTAPRRLVPLLLLIAATLLVAASWPASAPSAGGIDDPARPGRASFTRGPPVTSVI